MKIPCIILLLTQNLNAGDLEDQHIGMERNQAIFHLNTLKDKIEKQNEEWTEEADLANMFVLQRIPQQPYGHIWES